MPRTREEQELLDRRLMREVKRQNPTGIETALRDGADPNANTAGEMPLDALTHALEQRTNWFRRNWAGRIVVDSNNGRIAQIAVMPYILLPFVCLGIGALTLSIGALDCITFNYASKGYEFLTSTSLFRMGSSTISTIYKYAAGMGAATIYGSKVVGFTWRAINERAARRLGICTRILQEHGAATTMALKDGRSTFARLLDDTCSIVRDPDLERLELREFRSPSEALLIRMLSECRDPAIAAEYIGTILERGNQEKIELLLCTLVKQNPEMAKVILPESGESLLHIAARRDYVTLTRCLMEYGHDPSAISQPQRLLVATPATPKDLAVPNRDCAAALQIPDQQWFRGTVKKIRELKEKLLKNYYDLLMEQGCARVKRDEYHRDIDGRIENMIIELEGRVSYFERITPRDRQLTAYLLRGMEILCGETLRINPRIAREGIGVIRYARNQFGFGDPAVLGGILRDAYSRHIFPPRFPEFMAGDPVAGRIYRGLSAVYINIAMTPQSPPRLPAPRPTTAKKSRCVIM